MRRGWSELIVVALVSGVGAVAVAQTQPGTATATGPAAARTDADKERARTIGVLLRDDARLRDDEVTVEVTGKQVRLAGRVDTTAEKEHAEALVRKSDPTVTVENLLQADVATNDTDRKVGEAAEKTSAGARRAAQKAGKVAREAGDMASDGWITSKVKTKLMGADGVDASAIDVDTSDQVVTLRGQVKSETERQRALKLARDTRGVSLVVDELKVGTSGAAPRPAR